MADNYSQDSIRALKGAERVRTRPEIMFGSRGLEGVTQAIFEIISNGLDEVRAGYGTRVEVTYTAEGEVTVRDYGRGVPLDWNAEENEWNWHLVYNEMYAGGKYDTANYAESIGLNGVGAGSTQYVSEYMTVEAWRDGVHYTMNFKGGYPEGALIKEPYSGVETGTQVRFKPDAQVFDAIIVSKPELVSLLNTQAVMTNGAEIVLRYCADEEQVFFYTDGIFEYLDEVVPSRINDKMLRVQATLLGKDRVDKAQYAVTVEIAAVFVRDPKATILHYICHNGAVLTSGGISQTAFETGMTTAIDEELKKRGKYNKGEAGVQYRDIADNMSFVLKTSCPGAVVSYSGATKKAIANPFIGEAVTTSLSAAIATWITDNDDAVEKIVMLALMSKRARESSEEIKKSVIKKLSSSANTLMSRPENFVDCMSKDKSKREVYIVEGNSAKGSVKVARLAEFQAVMPVRGKIMNCLKEDISTILKSEIIIDLVRVLGCGIDVKKARKFDGLSQFDINNLNWGKVIICTDADLDGMQIRCLIVTMLYRLMPQLITAGKIYIAETPLFEIRNGGDIKFAYTEQEKEDILAEYAKQGKRDKVKIMRSKGLGENNPDMMHISTMLPSTRRLIQVTCDDLSKESVVKMFESLMGDDIEARRVMISEYAKLIGTSIDEGLV